METVLAGLIVMVGFVVILWVLVEGENHGIF